MLVLIMRRFFIMAFVGLLLSCVAAWWLTRAGETWQYCGSDFEGFKSARGCRVSPSKAVELAEPHLQQSFELRSRDWAEWNSKRMPPHNVVTRKGDWYYVARDDLPPSMTLSFYLAHAVRVHTQTGEVIEPQ